VRGELFPKMEKGNNREEEESSHGKFGIKPDSSSSCKK